MYGEKHRTQIEKALDSLYINSYITYEDVKSDYLHKFNQFVDMLGLDFLKEYGIPISKEEETDVYKKGTYSLDKEKKKIIDRYFGWNISKNSKIFNFSDELLNSAQEYGKNFILKERCDILKTFDISATPDNYFDVINTSEGQRALKEIKRVYDIAVKCKNKLEEFEQSNKDVEIYLSEGEKFKQELNVKYTRKYYEEIKPYLSKEEQDNINKMLEMENLNGIYLGDPNYIYSGNFLLESFSTENDEKIKQDNWEAKYLKEKRVKYFKAKGLDLGDDYSAYENSEETKKIIPSKEFVKKIIETKEKSDKDKNKEFLLETSTYLDNKAKLAEYNFLLGTEFNIKFVNDGVKCLVPNIIKDKNGEYHSYNIIHLPVLNMIPEFADVFAIHEILHGVETTMRQMDSENFQIKTGFEILEENLNEEKGNDDDENDKDLRKFELLSENIHQKLSIEVAKDMHKKGIYLINDPKNSREARRNKL